MLKALAILIAVLVGAAAALAACFRALCVVLDEMDDW